jgi:hypothetical protein
MDLDFSKVDRLSMPRLYTNSKYGFIRLTILYFVAPFDTDTDNDCPESFIVIQSMSLIVLIATQLASVMLAADDSRI